MLFISFGLESLLIVLLNQIYQQKISIDEGIQKDTLYLLKAFPNEDFRKTL